MAKKRKPLTPEQKEKQREYDRKRRLTPEQKKKKRESSRRWAAANRDKVNANNRRWAAANPAKVSAQNRKQYAKRSAVIGQMIREAKLKGCAHYNTGRGRCHGPIHLHHCYEKEFNLGQATRHTISAVRLELHKVQPLCERHHADVTKEEQELAGRGFVCTSQGWVRPEDAPPEPKKPTQLSLLD